MSPLLRTCSIEELLGPPLAKDWHAALTVSERETLASLKSPERRQQWLAGRVLAKQLIAGTLASEPAQVNWSEIEIVTRNALGQGIAPLVQVRGAPWTGCLSLAHQGGRVAAAILPDADWAIGIDLVSPEPLGISFADMWFTAAERAWVLADVDEPHLAASIWGLKEAAYKAINQGESFQPQAIEVGRNTAGQWRIAVRGMPAPGDWTIQVTAADGLLLATVFGRRA